MSSRQQQNVSGKLHGLAQAALHYARARLDLLLHEWHEEQSRLLGLLARAALFGFALLTTYQLIAITIIVAFWDTAYRIHSAVVMIAVTGGLAAYAWRTLQAGAARVAKPFALSLAEFEKDRTTLAQMATETTVAPAAPAAPASEKTAMSKNIGKDHPYDELPTSLPLFHAARPSDPQGLNA